METNSNDLIGKTLGNCTLEKLIGQGGMGAVYLARQARPARYVAVKVLLPQKTMDRTEYNAFLARFQREADIIAKLEHVNIMPIFEYGEQDGLAFLVMPHLTGGSMRDKLARQGPLPLSEAALYLDQAAAALDYAHTQGVIHRDIKPSNFLFHSDGRLVLADFGIARMMQNTSNTAMSTLTSAGALLGTPEYMAPEMARGEEVDERADIYEIGIVLYQMLSGRSPFKGESPLIVAVRQIHENLPSLHQINPAIPSSVDAVIQRATAKRREDRYPSVGALAREFYIAITPSLYPEASEAQSAPRAWQPWPHPTPTRPSGYETEPAPAMMEKAPNQPASAWSQSSSSGTNSPQTPILSQPITPYHTESAPPAKTRRPLFILLSTLVALVLIVGGIIVGLQLRGAFATNPPPGISTTVTVSPQSPSPTATSTPSQQAQAVVQQYFAYINKTDYQDAYNLWGADYRSKNSYSSFASGFSNTVRDDITFNSVTPLSDGTVQVSITIRATETTGMRTFQGYYIVGQENNSWKLLRANLQQVS